MIQSEESTSTDDDDNINEIKMYNDEMLRCATE